VKRETCSWPEKYRDRVQENGRFRDRINAVLVARVPGELSRFDNCQNVKMTAVIAFRSERLPAVEKMIRPLAFAAFLAGLRRV
jgi:hypothetical protein